MSTSPAGTNAGLFQLCDKDDRLLAVVGAPGNSRQRRRILRQLKKKHVVKQFNPETRAPRFER